MPRLVGHRLAITHMSRPGHAESDGRTAGEMMRGRPLPATSLVLMSGEPCSLPISSSDSARSPLAGGIGVLDGGGWARVW
jgi:hypothetical protein